MDPQQWVGTTVNSSLGRQVNQKGWGGVPNKNDIRLDSIWFDARCARDLSVFANNSRIF